MKQIQIIKCNSWPQYIGKIGWIVGEDNFKSFIAFDKETAIKKKYHAFFYKGEYILSYKSFN